MAESKPSGRASRLRITSCTQVYHGQNARGDQYTIYEVEATRENGAPVRERLRSFENLPLELIEVMVVPYRSAKFGISYTLSRRNRPNSAERIAELTQRADGLDRVVAELKSRLDALEGKPPPDPPGDDLAPTFGDIPV